MKQSIQLAWCGDNPSESDRLNSVDRISCGITIIIIIISIANPAMASKTSPYTKRNNKRQLAREFDKLASIENPTEYGENATVHGYITVLSPKKARYFDGSIADNKDSQMRFVGFNDKQRIAFEKFYKEKKAVALKNCRIKNAYSGEEKLEIIVSDSTVICESPRKLSRENVDIEECETESSSDLTLTTSRELSKVTVSDLGNLEQYAKVELVSAAVIRVGEVEHYQDKTLQNVTIEDASGSCQLTLWEKYVGVLATGSMYSMKNLMVKYYNGDVQLTTPKNVEVEFKKLPMTTENPYDDSSDHMSGAPVQSCHVKRAKLIAVTNFSNRRICLICEKGSVVLNAEFDPEIGVCSDCTGVCMIELCEETTKANVVVLDMDTKTRLNFVLRDENLKSVLAEGNQELNVNNLLKSPEFTLEYNGKNMMVTSIKREF